MAVLTVFPGDGTPRVVVELHDVAPPFEARIRAQLEILAAMGIERSVLYVVPNWHGAYPLAGSPSFVRLLRQQHEAGSELVLHGLEHQQRGPLRGPAQLRVRAGLFARGVAEFLSLTAPEVARGMQHARERFEALDLPAPSTFCAPGWLLAPDVTEALAAEGICRVAGMVSLIDLERSRQYLLPSLGYMGGGTIHETAISLSNRLVRLALPELSAVQTYLHPQGSMESPAARAVVRTVQQLVANGRRPATFEDLLPAQAAGH
jgi:predicted deacetylase